jgi:ABC-type dipeptide/oligopeptide/nickel transport system ATPase component
MLEQVRIARSEERYDAYPLELSGGMCQRVVIALALAGRPQLLITVEAGMTDQVLVAPRAPYTRDLLAAVPLPGLACRCISPPGDA